ncbi:tetratricopeptide repeat protein [Candidatus Palauibacter sp.]|uniref:tetratricopeptide repeat protein n=1 Tax=Candidatus Palauibacter sp. TaxID=3101350 RepID=UPI003B527AED
MSRAAVAVLLGVAAASCASRADVEEMGDALREDIRALEEGQRLLLDRVEGSLDNLETSSERREATGRGELERRTSRLEVLVEQNIELSTENNQLLANIYENQRLAGAPSPVGGPTGSPRPADPGPVSTSGSEEAPQFYGMALDTFNQGLLESARGAFRDFMVQWPRHELAPDAQFMLARTFEDDEDLGNALEEYRRLTELYPNSGRAPAALYRRGVIEATRGNTALARQLFTQIESGYPNSLEAPAARRERERLGG